ncbi:hypothetical protein HW532_12610 [Kaustia mangrovi]|uniref:Uncharacterized protein n=1 Tax=Kaustia mangrovi TaxID=2593653 RepID=A0A7S8C4W3_9HYPH|nr:hypothetical protein [Kaustia mangrovi]QPC43460.1 hypothetical protein HW532_12610 [Kaustia mangrovi]
MALDRVDSIIDSNGNTRIKFSDTGVRTLLRKKDGAYICHFEHELYVWMTQSTLTAQITTLVSVDATSPVRYVYGKYVHGATMAPGLFVTLLDQAGEPLPGVHVVPTSSPLPGYDVGPDYYHVSEPFRFSYVNNGLLQQPRTVTAKKKMSVALDIAPARSVILATNAQSPIGFG